jgi:putative ABC transport system permease protein
LFGAGNGSLLFEPYLCIFGGLLLHFHFTENSFLIAAIWALALVILLIAFAMIAGERKREFAVLRLLGTSRSMLGGLILKESALCSLAGGVLGAALASLIVFPFTTLIETGSDCPVCGRESLP